MNVNIWRDFQICISVPLSGGGHLWKYVNILLTVVAIFHFNIIWEISEQFSCRELKPMAFLVSTLNRCWHQISIFLLRWNRALSNSASTPTYPHSSPPTQNNLYLPKIMSHTPPRTPPPAPSAHASTRHLLPLVIAVILKYLFLPVT